MTVMHRWFKAGNLNVTYCGKRLETVQHYTQFDRLTTCRHCLRAMAQYTMNRVTPFNNREVDENAEPRP